MIDPLGLIMCVRALKSPPRFSWAPLELPVVVLMAEMMQLVSRPELVRFL